MGTLFEPTRKINNKISVTKNYRRPSIAKRSIIAEKMFVIFFDIRCRMMQLLVPIRKTLTGNFYRKTVLKKNLNINVKNVVQTLALTPFLVALQRPCAKVRRCDIDFERGKSSSSSACTIFSRSSFV